MFASRKTVPAAPASVAKRTSDIDLEGLSRDTGVPVELLRTFAAISDPANAHFFNADSARNAFSGVKVRRADD